MVQLTDTALDEARGYATRIAKRIESAGFGSSTLARLQSVLAEAGPVFVPSDRLTRLQDPAANLARVLRETDTRGTLAGTDLPRLRYLLATPPTYIPGAR